MHGMPAARRAGPVGGSNAVSEPVTVCPASTKSAARELMPVPEMPIRCTRTVSLSFRLREDELVAFHLDPHDAAPPVAAREDFFGERVLNPLEDGTLQRAPPEG